MKPQELISACREAKVNDFELVDKELKRTVCPECNGDTYTVNIPYPRSTAFKKQCEHCKATGIIIGETPPHMERVLAFLFLNNKISKQEKAIMAFELNVVWFQTDPTASHDFLWIVENAGDHYEELLKFCKQYIL